MASKKVLVYGGNIAGRALGNLVHLKIGHPVGAIFYGGLDILGRFSNKIKSSKYNRLAKCAGAIGYSASTIINLFSTLKGDYRSILQLPFDASMAYVLLTDSFDSYKSNNVFRDIKEVKGDVSRVLKKSQKGLESKL